jgi:CRISPR/Cas system-associated protein endoribonuclease Cas2
MQLFQEKGIIYVSSPHGVHIIQKHLERFSMSHPEDGSVGCLTVYTKRERRIWNL